MQQVNSSGRRTRLPDWSEQEAITAGKDLATLGFLPTLWAEGRSQQTGIMLPFVRSMTYGGLLYAVVRSRPLSFGTATQGHGPTMQVSLRRAVCLHPPGCV